MAENRKTFNISSSQPGEVKIADEVVAVIAGLAEDAQNGSQIFENGILYLHQGKER